MTLSFRPRLTAGTSVLLLALAGLSACDKPQNQAQQARPPANVEVVVLHPQSVSLTTELPGRLSPFRVAEVRPQVNGVILKRLFTDED